MDADQVPVYKLTRPSRHGLAVLLAAGLCAGALAGCGGAPKDGTSADALKDRAKEKVEKEQAPLDVAASQNAFTVDDPSGKRLLEAKVGKVDARIQPGTGPEGPVTLKDADCRLFKNGKPDMRLKSPEAIWDGTSLSTVKTAHAVTADGSTIFDSQKAKWTAKTGHLAMEDAKMRSLKKGKTDFSAEGRTATVVERVVTIPAGAVARNDEGQQLTANHVRWFLGSGKLEANGNVVITQEGMRVAGQRLVADTRLKKGRLTGGTHVRMARAQVKISQAPGGAGKKGRGKRNR